MSNPSAHRHTLTLPKGGSEAERQSGDSERERDEAISGLLSTAAAAASGFHSKVCDRVFSCACCLPNLFLLGPAERKKGRKGKKRTGRIAKSATVHRDSPTGNAERSSGLWLLLLDGQVLTKQEEEERQHFVKL